METSREIAEKTLEELRKRLLDKTSRNKLLKFNVSSKSGLRFIDELPDQLADVLLSDQKLSFRAVPVPKREELIDHGYLKIDEESGEDVSLKDYPDAEEWARILGLNTSYELPIKSDTQDSEKHQDDQIQTLLYPHELEGRAKKLLQTSNLAIQEMGANILYLALGFLEWSEQGDSQKRLAPLFLIPVRVEKETLSKKTKIYGYSISFSGEEIITNISLREKLREDFGLVLPELNEKSTPERYFKDVAKSIASQPSWKVRRYVSLALLNFSKMLMYLDLDPARWPAENKILDHPLILRFLAGYSGSEDEDEPDSSNYGFGEEYRIDEVQNIHETYPLIDDADSSQHSALIDAVKGTNLVIEGPPGTGKSQTITNLIAALLGQGKTVLFVAEKLAALDVVKRRLDHANLGDFCLELHSHKSQKQKVLEDLEQRLKRQGSYRSPSKIDISIDGFEKQKDKLNKHAELINRKWKATEKTISEIFMGAVRLKKQTEFDIALLHHAGHDGDSLTPVFLRHIDDLLQTYKKIHRSVVDRLPDEADTIDLHPWFGVQKESIQIIDRPQILSALEGWQKAINELQESGEDIAELLRLDPLEAFSSVSKLRTVALEIKALPKIKRIENFESLSKLTGLNYDRAKDYLKLYLSLKARAKDLSSRTGLEALANPVQVEHWQVLIKGLEKSITNDVSVEALRTALQSLQRAKSTLEEQKEALNHFASQAGMVISDTLAETISGFKDLMMLLNSISELDPGLAKMRDPLFDSEELDDILPRLGETLSNLHAQRANLEEIFDFSQVPEFSVVQAHYSGLKNAGVFSVFSSDWRKKRREVRLYLRNPKESQPKLNESFSALLDFLAARRDLENNKKYKAALGDSFNSIDTDVKSLVTLRDWYRRVREDFGIGIGPRVGLGTFVLSMSDEVLRIGRALNQQEVSRKIKEAIDRFEEAGEVFRALGPVGERETLQVLGQGPIQDLLDETHARLSELDPLVNKESSRISEYACLIDDLDAYQTLSKQWNHSSVNEDLFGGRLNLNLSAYESDKDSLEALAATLSLAEAINAISSPGVATAIHHQANELFFENLDKSAQELTQRVDQVIDRGREFSERVDLDQDAWCGGSIEDQSFEILLARNQVAIGDSEALLTWLSYLRSRVDLYDEGLKNLVENIETGALSTHQMEHAYKAAIFDQLSREIFSEEPRLNRFSGAKQQALQERLAQYDEELKSLQQRAVASRSAKVQIPVGNSGGRVAAYTERSLLEHEMTKKKRHLPIRQLMNRAGAAISSLKPCYMMGPMSVAQYLRPGKYEFDVLIMDEASQIKPEEALGAIARAKQLIVVGDPNQLPPTNFFDRINEEDDEDNTSIQQSESILDATLPIFKKRRLRWHYRSQHESLIAFSNHFFYNDDLVVFPSPMAEGEDLGVRNTFVPDGVFANRRNLAEVKVIARAVRRHLLTGGRESLGVVAMNTEQSEHIEAAIEQLSKEDEQFRRALERDENSLEPLFIKNLENVQGDERDVILISMTYGPQDPRGRVLQRFGPINTDVGWRRLNVLFTRAKKRMHIFTSMKSDDIVVGPNSKRGVEAFRDFLKFSETGILSRTKIGSGKAPDSDFEIAVISLLSRRGYECVPQVGVSGYFIDIAVKDPTNPGRFLMGIECDGASYHSAKSARDRDRLRQEILERLGWRIRRIWSTDWFNNPDAEIQPILDELDRLQADSKNNEGNKSSHEIPLPVENHESDDDATGTVVPVREIIENEIGIREGLEWLAKEIQRKCPATPAERRLLRPAMIEAITKYQPLNKTEFLRVIPEYLRERTDPKEGRFLEHVFEVVNGTQAYEESSGESTVGLMDEISAGEMQVSEKTHADRPAIDVAVPESAELQPGGENLSSSVMRDLKKARIVRSGAQNKMDRERIIGNSVEQIAVKLELHRLREKIWKETSTEPDKFGILKRNLVREYLQRPIASLEEWEALVGSEARTIHESHKAYIPEIIDILSKLKGH